MFSKFSYSTFLSSFFSCWQTYCIFLYFFNLLLNLIIFLSFLITIEFELMVLVSFFYLSSFNILIILYNFHGGFISVYLFWLIPKLCNWILQCFHAPFNCWKSTIIFLICFIFCCCFILILKIKSFIWLWLWSLMNIKILRLNTLLL